MAATIINSFLNAMTPQGLVDMLSNGFGVGAPRVDTAAFILGPSTLLTNGNLASTDYTDLQLDAESEASMVGLFTVTPPDTTGLTIVSWQVTLNVTPNTTPIGMALYASDGPDLWIITLFDPNIPMTESSYQWSGQMAVNMTLCQS